MADGEIPLLFKCVAILFVIGIGLLVILLPMSFSSLNYYEVWLYQSY